MCVKNEWKYIFFLPFALMSRTILFFSHTHSWCGQGQFCFYHHYISELLAENSKLKPCFKIPDMKILSCTICKVKNKDINKIPVDRTTV